MGISISVTNVSFPVASKGQAVKRNLHNGTPHSKKIYIYIYIYIFLTTPQPDPMVIFCTMQSDAGNRTAFAICIWGVNFLLTPAADRKGSKYETSLYGGHDSVG